MFFFFFSRRITSCHETSCVSRVEFQESRSSSFDFWSIVRKRQVTHDDSNFTMGVEKLGVPVSQQLNLQGGERKKVMQRVIDLAVVRPLASPSASRSVKIACTHVEQ